MTINPDFVCPHADLVTEIGGQEQMDTILAQSKNGSTLADRTSALAVVMKTLSRRTPPIHEEDIADATELHDAVAYGAAERLYAQAVTTADSVFEARRKRYAAMFEDELKSLMPTLNVLNVRGPSAGFRTERG